MFAANILRFGALTPVILTFSGPVSGQINFTQAQSLGFGDAGTYTITVNKPVYTRHRGIAGGGSGGRGLSDSTRSTGGTGGGGGAYNMGDGVLVTLVPTQAYTLVLGAGGIYGSNGGNTSFANGSTTVMLLGGGLSGANSSAGYGGTAYVNGYTGPSGGRGGNETYYDADNGQYTGYNGGGGGGGYATRAGANGGGYNNPYGMGGTPGNNGTGWTGGVGGFGGAYGSGDSGGGGGGARGYGSGGGGGAGSRSSPGDGGNGSQGYYNIQLA